MNNPKKKIQDDTDVLEKETNEYQIVIFNDDVNTFQHVILSLMEICKHELIQAEQCAHIIHNNGKCTVKTGEYTELEPQCTSLLQRGLSAEIM